MNDETEIGRSYMGNPLITEMIYAGLVQEKKEIDEKIIGFNSLVNCKKSCKSSDAQLCEEQLAAMIQYSKLLNERILRYDWEN